MLQIKTNVTKSSILYHPELSYSIVGVLFSTHNELGPWAKEKQYGDVIARKLKELNLPFLREYTISDSGNIVDFIIDQKILLELKAKRILVKEDFDQTQRYLQETKLQLALLVNFRSRNLRPIRVVKIDLL